jgi:hypothetical protein
MGDSVTLRCFAASPEVYDQWRAALDSAWGLPANGQQTVLPPLKDAPVVGGRVYFAATASHCDYEPVATMLPAALASGEVAEVSEAQYVAAVTSIPRPAGT